MQHATPEAYEAEAERFRQLAEQREREGRTYAARQYREMADNCDERAAQVRNG
jgi:hypothetical protein